MKKQKMIYMILFALLFACCFSAVSVDSYAASKKYTKTYKLERKLVKSVKLKSKIKSVKSSNKKVATVKKSGKTFKITTKKKGTAIITVKCKNKKTYRYKVKVSNKKHKHSWKDKTWTEDVVSGEMVEVFVCDCNIEWSTIDELKAHQDNDIAYRCVDCGHKSSILLDENGVCKHCGSSDIRNSVCRGWRNKGKWIETITQITHHYRECACGARKDID